MDPSQIKRELFLLDDREKDGKIVDLSQVEESELAFGSSIVGPLGITVYLLILKEEDRILHPNNLGIILGVLPAGLEILGKEEYLNQYRELAQLIVRLWKNYKLFTLCMLNQILCLTII